MYYEGIFCLVVFVFFNYNTIAFPCFAAETVFKWKIDKYLMAVSSSHNDTEVSSLKIPI